MPGEHIDQEKDEILRRAFKSDQGRISLFQAMRTLVRVHIHNNLARRGLTYRFSCRDDDMVFYDTNAAFLGGSGGLPVHKASFKKDVPFFEVCSHGTHKPDLLEARNLYDFIMKIPKNASKEIIHKEESSFLTLVDSVARKTKAKNLKSALVSLIRKGVSLIGISPLQSLEGITSFISVVPRFPEPGMIFYGVPSIVSKEIPLNVVYGFKETIGDLWVERELDVIAADEIKDEEIVNYGYAFSETVSMVVSQPKNVFKVAIEG